MMRAGFIKKSRNRFRAQERSVAINDNDRSTEAANGIANHPNRMTGTQALALLDILNCVKIGKRIFNLIGMISHNNNRALSACGLSGTDSPPNDGLIE